MNPIAAAGIIPQFTWRRPCAGSRSQQIGSHLLLKYAMSIVIGSLLLTMLLVSQLIPLPEFSTDVSDFAPPNESEDRIQVIESEFPPQMSRIYVDVKSSNGVIQPALCRCFEYPLPEI